MPVKTLYLRGLQSLQVVSIQMKLKGKTVDVWRDGELVDVEKSPT